MLGDDGVFPGARCWQALASACRGLTGGLLGGRYVREKTASERAKKGRNGPPPKPKQHNRKRESRARESRARDTETGGSRLGF